MSPPQLYVQAGVVLETLDSVLADQGMMVPLDLGAKVLKICQIRICQILPYFHRGAVTSVAMSAPMLEVYVCLGLQNI